MEIVWTPQHPSPQIVSNVKPGLYQLSVLKPGKKPTGQEAWIIVAAPQEYEQTATAFHEAVALTDTWGKQTTPTQLKTARSFLRAYLAHLSRERGHER